jgi:hypothetical protein
MRNFGFVYILASDAMPGIYKVGSTEYSPRERAVDLSRGTGVPAPYRVVFYGEVEGALAWEKQVHLALADRRITDSREFFRGPLIDIIRTIEGDGALCSEWDSDEAREARQPGSMNSRNPLWFEANLYPPGYIERLRRASA